MIKLVVDSTCDIPDSLIKEYDIRVLPITVDIEGVIYKDKEDLTARDFYAKLKEIKGVPKTAQINPAAFEEAFRDELEKGNDIICLTISSGLSGTYNSANIAKDVIESEKIHVLDSKSASLGFGMIVLEIAKLIKNNVSLDIILKRAEEMIKKQRAIGYVDSLDMLKRSGRISASSAIIGGALGIKPIITLEDGLIKSASKARGKKNALKQLVENIKASEVDTSVGLYVAHSNMEEGCQSELELLKKNNINHSVITSEIGASVGAHIGENSCVVFFIEK